MCLASTAWLGPKFVGDATFARRRRQSSASKEAEEMAKGAAKVKRARAEALERRVPSEGRSRLKRSEEVARTAKVQHVQRRDVW